MAAESKNLPPYSPYESTVSVVDHMVKTLVPQRLDRELMPKMAGGMRSNVLSGLKYLGLIDAGNHPLPALEALVEARKAGNGQWGKAIEKIVKDKYAWALSGFDLTRVTSKQLRERFKDVGGVDGIMADRAIRFFLKAMTDAQIPYAEHLKARKPRGTGTVRRQKADESQNGDTTKQTRNKTITATPADTPDGMISFPVPFKGRPGSSITVHDNITVEECAMLDLALQIVKAYAAQQAGE